MTGNRFESSIEIPPTIQLWIFPRGDDEREGGHPRPAYMLANTLACDGYAVSKFTGVRVEYTDPADRLTAERVAQLLRFEGWIRARAKAKRLKLGEAGA